jgi:CBS domain-containing protein
MARQPIWRMTCPTIATGVNGRGLPDSAQADRQAFRGDVEPLTPQDSLERAVEVFAENDLQEVPVVNTRPDNKLVGMVRRTDIARAYLRRVHAEKTQVE